MIILYFPTDFLLKNVLLPTFHYKNKYWSLLTEELIKKLEKRKAIYNKLHKTHAKKCRELAKARNDVSDKTQQLVAEKLNSKGLERKIVSIKRDSDACELIESLKKNFSFDDNNLSGSTVEEVFIVYFWLFLIKNHF